MMPEISDQQLLAYVQKRLSAPEVAQLEQLLAQQPHSTLRLTHLRQGELPYAAAFAQEPLPPLPPELAAQVQLWCQLSAASKAPTAPPQQSWWQRLRDYFARNQFLSNASGTPLGDSGKGALIWRSSAIGLLLSVGASAGWLAANWQSSANNAPLWTQAVAQYQQLYRRETVANANFDANETQALLNQLEQQHGLKISIPDFSAAGLELKRVQLLGLAQQPIVQIVYLPKNGLPIALCLTRANANKPAELNAQNYLGQHLLSWQDNKVAYLLIGTQAPQQLQQLAHSLPLTMRPPALDTLAL